MSIRSILVVLALSCGGCFGGCGTSGSDFCDVACDCDYCSDRDYDYCLDSFDRDADLADRRGCSDFFDDYAACVEDYGGCGSHYGCGREWDDYRDCVD